MPEGKRSNIIEATDEEIADRILEKVVKQGNGELRRTDLNYLFGGRISKPRVDRALALLVRQGRAVVTTFNWGGPPTQCIMALRDDREAIPA